MRQFSLYRNRYKKLCKQSLGLALSGALLFVAGCGPLNTPKRNVLGDTDGSQARRAKLNTDVPLEDLRQLATPAEGANISNNLGLSSPGEGGQKGLNLTPQTDLFGESLRDRDDRLDRLEFAVQDIRDEIDRLNPSIDRLMAIESDMKELFGQLRVLLGEEDRVEAVLASPAPVQKEGEGDDAPLPIIESSKKSLPKAATKKVQTPKKAPVKRDAPLLRSSDSAQKTRIVFETEKAQNISADFDADNQVLVFETDYSLPESMIKGLIKKSKSVTTADVIESGDKSSFALGVKAVSSITKITHLKPNKDNANHRYFIDLMK